MRIGISGLGRIGRGLLKCLIEDKRFDITALNDVASCDAVSHLLNHDSYYHEWSHRADADGTDSIRIDNLEIPFLHEADPQDIRWDDYSVDWVVDSTGRFKDRASLEGHEVPVILSAASCDTDRQVVFGVNHKTIKPGEHILSATSCTTHCIASPLKILTESFTVENVLFNTVHCYNVSQTLVDAPKNDLRRARAGALNMIPTTTSASKAIESVIPYLDGKIEGMAIRVPAPAASLTEIVVNLKETPSVETVLNKLRTAAKNEMKGILATTNEELVSQDFVGNTASSVIDESLTVSSGNMIRLVAWYDNESGYIHRLLDLLAYLGDI